MKTLRTSLLSIAAILLCISFIVSKSKHTRHLDYRSIAFTQNELILTQEETIEELATIIQATLPAYRTDYSTIDSLNYVLDSLYTTKQ